MQKHKVHSMAPLCRRGLPVALDETIPPRRSGWRPARRLCCRCLAPACRPEWLPAYLPQPAAGARRAADRRNRGMDSGGAVSGSCKRVGLIGIGGGARVLRGFWATVAGLGCSTNALAVEGRRRFGVGYLTAPPFCITRIRPSDTCAFLSAMSPSGVRSKSFLGA
jgi:hypothetical protein